MSHTVTVLYFAWVRERMQKSEEQIELPQDVTTGGELIRFLAERDDHGAYAFEQPDVIKLAINKRHATPDTSLSEAHEIAIFPPMTGG